MKSSSKYIISTIDSDSSQEVFSSSLEIAIESMTWYFGEPSEFRTYLAECKQRRISNLKWSDKQFRSQYAEAAFELVADIYESMNTRFVAGGSGEGWIFNKNVKF